MPIKEAKTIYKRLKAINIMNILYLMNVDWNWIKQRPHFIAEELAKDNNITVLYQYRYKRAGYQNRKNEEYVNPVYVVPRGDRNTILLKINTWIWKKTIQRICRHTHIDCIYITYPTQINYIEGYSGNILYDCMDNHIAFTKDDTNKEKLFRMEKALVSRSNAILCSSNKLAEVLQARYGSSINKKLHLVRNGYDGKILTINDKEPVNNEKLILTYFGTISTWFNFDFIMRSLVDIPNIEYRLIGPVVDATIPENKRIKYLGTVEHSELFNYIKDSRCLIMPFVINDIIEAVDPVKLYEYINFDKNIIVSKYPEIERFDPFVYFYSNYDEYISQIRSVISNKKIKYNEDERTSFLISNSWKTRAQQIGKILINLENNNENS